MEIKKISDYIFTHLKKLSVKIIYTALLLFYAYQREGTPAWAKRIIIGTLAYFLAPLDAVPDLTPFFGYTDDFGVLSFGLVTIACYIDDGVKSLALERLTAWCGKFDLKDLEEVNEML